MTDSNKKPVKKSNNQQKEPSILSFFTKKASARETPQKPSPSTSTSDNDKNKREVTKSKPETINLSDDDSAGEKSAPVRSVKRVNKRSRVILSDSEEEDEPEPPQKKAKTDQSPKQKLVIKSSPKASSQIIYSPKTTPAETTKISKSADPADKKRRLFGPTGSKSQPKTEDKKDEEKPVKIEQQSKKIEKSPKKEPEKPAKASPKTKTDNAKLDKVPKAEKAKPEVKKVEKSQAENADSLESDLMSDDEALDSQPSSQPIVLEVKKEAYTPLPRANKNNQSEELWVEKYKPAKMDDLVGNNSHIEELSKWLKSWEEKFRFTAGDSKPKRGKAKEEPRAAIITGPPGIGKTTTAKLVCEKLKYEIVELNASDARSKKTLHQEIAELTTNRTINEFFGKKNEPKRVCIVMDEVDGMSSGDRGGVAELNKLIKTTRVPIICICNDRSKPALKTLIGNCLDIKFTRPNVNTIIKRIQTICAKENFKIDKNALEVLIKSSGNDIRSILNNLQMMSRSKQGITYNEAKKIDVSKDSAQHSIFDVTKELLEPPKKSYDKYLDLYFTDPMFTSLFVQENYLNVKPVDALNDINRLERLSIAADSISMGDVVNTKLRSTMSWSLATTHADFSCIRPSYFVRGHYQKLRVYDRYYSFPACLGKMSTTNKNIGVLRSIQKASSIAVTGNNVDILDYLPLWRDNIIKPLIEEGNDGIEEAIAKLDEYGLTKDDLQSIQEISTLKFKLGKDQYKDVATSTKTAFTRAFNKAHKGFTKASSAKSADNRQSVADMTNPDADEELLEEEDEDTIVDELIAKQKVQAKQAKFAKRQAAAEKKAAKTTKKTTSRSTKATTKKTKEPAKKKLVVKT